MGKLLKDRAARLGNDSKFDPRIDDKVTSHLRRPFCHIAKKPVQETYKLKSTYKCISNHKEAEPYLARREPYLGYSINSSIVNSCS